MLRLPITIALACLGGCAGMDLPRHAKSRPARLARAEAPADPVRVRLGFKKIRMGTWIDNAAQEAGRIAFRVAVPAVAPGRKLYAPCSPGCRRLGEVRSANVTLGEEAFVRLICGWKALGVGQPRPQVCQGRDARADRGAATRHVDRAVAALRVQAAAAGATRVEQIRCYGRGRRRTLWCEGVARAPGPGARAQNRAGQAGPATLPSDDSAASPSTATTPGSVVDVAARPLQPQRFVIGATAEVGYRGGGLGMASAIVFRYRPLEAALRFSHVRGKDVFSIGASALYRRELTGWGLGLVAGGEIGWGFPLENSSEAQPEGSMLTLTPFAGLTWQSRSLGDVVEVFLDLTGGYLFVPLRSAALPADRQIHGPVVSLALGLNWPERRR